MPVRHNGLYSCYAPVRWQCVSFVAYSFLSLWCRRKMHTSLCLYYRGTLRKMQGKRDVFSYLLYKRETPGRFPPKKQSESVSRHARCVGRARLCYGYIIAWFYVMVQHKSTCDVYQRLCMDFVYDAQEILRVKSG